MDIMDDMGIKEDRVPVPTYWYWLYRKKIEIVKVYHNICMHFVFEKQKK